MTDLSPQKNQIQQEEVSFRSAVSEGTFSRIGSSINFINSFQHLIYQFNINGNYGTADTPITQIDGLMGILFNIEITGVMVFGAVNSGTGTTQMDIHRLTSGGTDSGSIFGTKPQITSSAAASAYAIRDLLTPTDYTATGITLPTITTTTLNAGDSLRFDLDSVMDDGENCGLHIFYRPR